MADRTRGTLPPATTAGVVGALLQRVQELEARLEALEAQRGRSLPDDYRFTTEDGGAIVVVRRVSTGGSAPIVGPL